MVSRISDAGTSSCRRNVPSKYSSDRGNALLIVIVPPPWASISRIRSMKRYRILGAHADDALRRSGGPSRDEQDSRQRVVSRVGQGQRAPAEPAGGRQPGGFSAEDHTRPPAGFAYDLHILPTRCTAHACPQPLEDRFLGRVPRCEVFERAAAPETVAQLFLGKDVRQEPRLSLERPSDLGDRSQIDAD